MTKENLFDINISPVNLEIVRDKILNYNFNRPTYSCFLDMSVVARATRDKKLRHIIEQSYFSLPDGKPIETLLRLKGNKQCKTVSGFWLMHTLFKTDLKHFFYGSSDPILKKMIEKVSIDYPKAKIVGSKSPPFFKNVGEIEANVILQKDIEYINNIKPDLIWIGISSPKQDYLMAYLKEKIEFGHMLGVGAVFDYMAGTHKLSPEWIKKLGLRWLYRLFQDPRRLWKKYVFTFWYIFIYLLKKPFVTNS